MELHLLTKKHLVSFMASQPTQGLIAGLIKGKPMGFHKPLIRPAISGGCTFKEGKRDRFTRVEMSNFRGAGI